MTQLARALSSFSDNERAVILERRNGREKATIALLADVFDTNPHVIKTILRTARTKQALSPEDQR